MSCGYHIKCFVQPDGSRVEVMVDLSTSPATLTNLADGSAFTDGTQADLVWCTCNDPCPPIDRISWHLDAYECDDHEQNAERWQVAENGGDFFIIDTQTGAPAVARGVNIRQ